MVQMIRPTSGIGRGIEQAGSALGQSLQNILERKQQASKSEHESTLVGNIIEEVQQNAIESGRNLDESDYITILQKSLQSGIPLDRLNFASDLAKTQIASEGRQSARDQNLEMLTAGLSTLQEMKNLVSRGNIGTSLGFATPDRYFGQTAKDRGQFAQLGRSLIPLAAQGVTIKTQKEFEEYKKAITNPDARFPEMQGALEGLEKIIKGRLQSKSQPQDQVKEKVEFTLKEMPPPSQAQGKIIEDEKGNRYKSDGKKWTKVR